MLTKTAKLIDRIKQHAEWADRRNAPKVAADLRRAARLLASLASKESNLETSPIDPRVQAEVSRILKERGFSQYQ